MTSQLTSPNLARIAKSALATVVILLALTLGTVPASAAAQGFWRNQASYPWKSWCVNIGKFWNGQGLIDGWKCVHTPSRPWNAQWALKLHYSR